MLLFWSLVPVSIKCFERHQCTGLCRCSVLLALSVALLVRSTRLIHYKVVQGQQSLSECGEDEGDCCWLQESAHSACSSDHQWCDRGESEQHQVPGCAHHRGPLLDQQHCSTGEESTTASLLPPQTQKNQSPDPHHVHLLQRYHRAHPD